MQIKEKRFLKQHFQDLLTLGMELQTIEKKDGWSYLMAHGYCFYTNWTIDKLNQKQLLKLQAIVEAYIKLFPSADKTLLSSIKSRNSAL